MLTRTSCYKLYRYAWICAFSCGPPGEEHLQSLKSYTTPYTKTCILTFSTLLAHQRPVTGMPPCCVVCQAARGLELLCTMLTVIAGLPVHNVDVRVETVSAGNLLAAGLSGTVICFLFLHKVHSLIMPFHQWVEVLCADATYSTYKDLYCFLVINICLFR